MAQEKKISQNEIKVSYSPLLHPIGRSTVVEIPPAPRLPTLAGKKVALISNNKPNADNILKWVKEFLFDNCGLTEIIEIKKPHPTFPLEKEEYPSILKADASILAVGSCGSCSAWLTSDAVEIEKRGRPTASFCTHHFSTAGRFQAMHLGLRQLPIVIIKGPVDFLSSEEVRSIVDPLTDEVLKALTSSPQELATKYDWSGAVFAPTPQPRLKLE